MRIQMYRNDVSISQLTCLSVDKFENYRLIHSFHVKSELAKPSCELCSVIDLLMEWTKFAYISPGTDVDGYQCMCMYIGINLNPIIRLPLRIVTNILFLLMRSAGKLNPWEWKMNSRNVCLTLRLWHWKCLYKICMYSTLFFCASSWVGCKYSTFLSQKWFVRTLLLSLGQHFILRVSNQFHWSFHYVDKRNHEPAMQ